MYPPHEHAFYAWLIIISAVCIAIIIGAVVDRFIMGRHIHSFSPVRVKTTRFLRKFEK